MGVDRKAMRKHPKGKLLRHPVKSCSSGAGLSLLANIWGSDLRRVPPTDRCFLVRFVERAAEAVKVSSSIFMLSAKRRSAWLDYALTLHPDMMCA
jgi:hypothetical protein